MTPPMPVEHQPRFVYRDIPLTPKESHETWCRSLDCALARIKDLESLLIEAGAELAELQAAPLPVTRSVQIILCPGDLGYDEAPVGLSPTQYIGEYRWVNYSTNTP